MTERESGVSPELALAHVVEHLRGIGRGFALVGGLAVSVRAEVRFTRDVDLVIASENDADVERLVHGLRTAGYRPVTLVEHRAQGRLATVRLESPSAVVVDLIAATCGIEAEIVMRATNVEFDGIGAVPVACPEELLAMKVLSMTDRRLQDRIDAINLALTAPDLDLERVRENLRLIEERGYHRQQDLGAKLAVVLDLVAQERDRGSPR